MVQEPSGAWKLVGIVSWGAFCESFGAYSRVRDFRYWILSHVGPSTSFCSGRTPPGHTDWVANGTNELSLVVDTSACNFASAPRYFTSLGGDSSHYLLDGPNAIVSPNALGFEVRVRGSGLSPGQANQKRWPSNGTARTRAAPALPLQPHGPSRGPIQISQTEITPCNLPSRPSYLTSLVGAGDISSVRGVTAIHAVSGNNFTISLYANNLTPAVASANNWRINWRSFVPPASSTDTCSGTTVQGSTNWVQHLVNVIYTDVNTASCGFVTTPKYFTTLDGTSGHINVQGTTSIYTPTPTGFRVYVKRSGATPSYANQRNWHVRWTGMH